MGEVRKAPATVPLSSIDMGKRARTIYEDVPELAVSILERGFLLERVVVKRKEEGKDEFLLAAGGRRLRSHELLVAGFEHGGKKYEPDSRWSQIDVEIVPPDTSDIEMKWIEYDENAKRKNLQWQEEVALRNEITLMAKELGMSNPQEAAAEKLGVDLSTISADVNLAKAMEKVPELKKCKTKEEARKKLNQLQERVLVRELAKREERKTAAQGIDKTRSILRQAYIISDFFEGVQKVKDGTIDFIDLDPPYGIDFDTLFEGRSDENPNIDQLEEFKPEEYEGLVKRAATEAYRVAKENAWLVCWHSGWMREETYRALIEAGWKVNRLPILWIKPGQGRVRNPSTCFTPDYEMAYYARKGNAQLAQQGPSSIFTCSVSKDHIHPNEKPVSMLQEVMSKFISPGQRCMSCFLGSGNILLASANLGLQAFGFDKSQVCKDGYTLRVGKWEPSNEAKQD